MRQCFNAVFSIYHRSQGLCLHWSTISCLLFQKLFWRIITIGRMHSCFTHLLIYKANRFLSIGRHHFHRTCPLTTLLLSSMFRLLWLGYSWVHTGC